MLPEMFLGFYENFIYQKSRWNSYKMKKGKQNEIKIVTKN